MDAKRYTGMTDHDVINEISHNLADMFKLPYTQVRNKLVDHVIQRWLLDKNYLGSFAFFRMGEVSKAHFFPPPSTLS